MTARPVRVTLVDDHRLLSDSLVAALTAEGFAVRAVEPSPGPDLVHEIAATTPDLVLLDLDLGDSIDGTVLVRPLRAAGARVLVMTASTDALRHGAVLEQGAVGVLQKSRPFDELLTGITAAACGEDLLSPEDRRGLIRRWRAAAVEERDVAAGFARLSTREASVLEALQEGRSVREIAVGWHVSEATVRSQVHAILTKLGVTSQLQAVALARRGGWVPPA
ncbi:response regulator transcription factor [Nocardioides dongkuii]|uniref:response regulator transcription factor n=1 Tax=Nocardioides dongkuii TaxID=2760089 RepID=UPI0015FA295A|nr:response regulator transcription factor [Nocardioides dongkuii]